MTGTDRELCITFLDVGQGDATIILPPSGEGQAVLFDCGRDGWEVVQQLKVWGIERLEAVIASHLDLDHIGGMLTVLDAFRDRVETVYFSADRDLTDEHEDARTAKALADRVNEGSNQAWEMREVHSDSRPVSEGSDWSIHVVAPHAGVRGTAARKGWEDANRYSAVLRIEMAGTVVLIGGDAPLMTWSEIKNLRAHAFRVPHHGGALDDGTVPAGWSAAKLYDEVAPGVAAISVGTNNPYEHPDSARWIRPLVGRSECRLLCTQVTGRCHSSFDRGRADDAQRLADIARVREELLPAPHPGSSHFVEPPWRHYARRSADLGLLTRSPRPEVPCAGTISVRVDAMGAVRVDPSPENPSLVSRIDRWSSPLCRR